MQGDTRSKTNTVLEQGSAAVWANVFRLDDIEEEGQGGKKQQISVGALRRKAPEIQDPSLGAFFILIKNVWKTKWEK